MNKIVQQTRKLFTSVQGSMFSSALILGFMIIVSRIFGFLRYRILAGYFGKDQLDIFFASFRIPDLVFELLITGAITSSLIPIYIAHQKDEVEKNKSISSIITIITTILIATIAVAVPFMHLIVPIITPGFTGEKLHDVVYYSRLLLIGQLPFLVLGNLLTGIAQAKKKFLATAIPPILYNLSVIISTLALTSSVGLYAPFLGVVFGAFIFMAIQIPAVWKDVIEYRPQIVITRGVKDFFRITGPRLLTILVAQIDATIDLTLTTLLGPGAYTTFYLAQHLQLLPVSVIGMAFGQASLPFLSELAATKKQDELSRIIMESILNIIFLTLPIAVFFVFARTPLVRLFFGGQKFDWDATVQTAFLLSYFSLSIPLHAIYYFLTRCFYALLDSKTPFIISIIGIGTNTVLSIVFVLLLRLPVWSLGISFSLSMSIQVFLLLIYLTQKVPFAIVSFLLRLFRILVCGLLAAPFPYVCIKLLDNLLLDTTRTINIFLLLVGSSSLYLLIYLFLSWLFSVSELYVITNLFKAKGTQKKVIEMYSSYD